MYKKIISISIALLLMFSNCIYVLAADDLTPPVITGMTWSATELKAGDKLGVEIDANDTESGILDDSYEPRIFIEHSVTGIYKTANLDYDETTKKFKGTLTVTSDMQTGEWKLDFIIIKDKAGNQKYYYPRDFNQEYKFNLIGGTTDITPPVITGMTWSSTELKAGDKLGVEIDANDTESGILDDSYEPRIFIEHSVTGIYKTANLDYDETTKKFKGTLTVTSDMQTGEWKLDFIIIKDKAGNQKYYYPRDFNQEYKFNLIGGTTDITPPVITGMTWSSTELKAGDKLGVEIDANDTESGILDDSYEPRIFIEHSVTGIYKTANLDYDETTKKFKGTLTVTSDMQTGEWKLDFIIIKDKAGNQKYYYPRDFNQEYKFNLKSVTINSYTVTFNSQGGSTVANTTADFNTTIVAPISPTRTGYTFGGWYKEAECVNEWNFATDKVTEDTILYAKWTINKYSVNFNSQGGSEVSNKDTDYNTIITAPTKPIKKGYTFGGWYKEASCTNVWDFTTDKVTENTTLYAKWTMNKYTVTFNSQGGSIVSSNTADYNNLLPAPTAPTKIGYTFGGWYKEASCINAWNFGTDKVTTNTTLYAKWTVNKYTIKFDNQIGNVTVRTSNYNTNINEPSVPTRTNYKFNGWYTAPNGGTKVVFPYTIKDNVTLYAQWTITSLNNPTGLTAKALNDNSVKLTWSAVNGASGYEIYRATSSTGTYTLLTNTTSLNYTNTGLTTNTTYYYKIRAYVLSGTTKVYSGYTTVVSARPILAVPTNLIAKSLNYNSTNLSWRAVNGASGYEIYRATSSTGTYTLLTNTTSLNYTNTGLTTNTTYYYKIRAYVLSGTTKVYSGYTTVVSARPILAVPTNLIAKSLNYNSTNLSWRAVSGASGYEIYRATSSTGTYTLLVNTTSLNYTNTGLTTNATYYYKIRAYKVIGKTKVYSGYTTVVSAKPILAVPTYVVAKRVNSTSINLNWGATSGASGYEVYRATSSTGTYTLLTSTTNLNYVNKGLVANKPYYYKIRAYKIIGKTKVYSGYINTGFVK